MRIRFALTYLPLNQNVCHEFVASNSGVQVDVCNG